MSIETVISAEDYARVVAERDRARSIAQLLEEELNIALERLSKYETPQEDPEVFHINHGD